MIVLYTIDCPKCKVLENLLKKNQVEYEICKDMNLMKEKGFRECPKLEVDGELYGFSEAIKLVKEGKVA